MIKWRSTIGSAIGHMKAVDKLDRDWLKGPHGDALHAVLRGAGHNIRLILRKLRRLLCAWTLRLQLLDPLALSLR